MNCACGAPTAVADSRKLLGTGYVQRRRDCIRCGKRTKTFEIPEADFKQLQMMVNAKRFEVRPLVEQLQARLQKMQEETNTIHELLFTNAKTEAHAFRNKNKAAVSPSISGETST